MIDEKTREKEYYSNFEDYCKNLEKGKIYILKINSVNFPII